MRLFSYFSQMVQVHFVTEQQHPVTVSICPLQFVENTPGPEQRWPVLDGVDHQKDLARKQIKYSLGSVKYFQGYPVISDVNRLVV